MQEKQAINYKIIKRFLINKDDFNKFEKEINSEIYDSWEPIGCISFLMMDGKCMAVQNLVQYRYHY